MANPGLAATSPPAVVVLADLASPDFAQLIEVSNRPPSA